MKGLRKYISPFTPDQSGAVSVLYGCGGMLIIMDAGGCVGNICGFDEPRWLDSRSAVFSAGLRDLDAILGRDDLLIKKTREALADVDAVFVGLIGTPVPSVIATDYRALKRLMEKDYGIPVIPVETNGMELYDRGQDKAYRQLFAEFAGNGGAGEEECGGEVCDIGIIGATPLDTPAKDSPEHLRALCGGRAVCYGAGDGIRDVMNAHAAKKNLVVSPSGLGIARMMKEEAGIPYETGYPVEEAYCEKFLARLEQCSPRKVLVIHQQIFADGIRQKAAELPGVNEADTATWFMLDKEIMKSGDAKLREEDDLMELVTERGYDTVIGDPLFRRALPGWKGNYFSLPHFAVSGSLHAAENEEDYWRNAGELI